MDRYPWANFVLVGATVIVSLGAIWQPELCENLALGQRDIPPALRYATGPASTFLDDLYSKSDVEFRPLGYVTHGFVHGGYLHLFGNMLFLFVFGNAVNAKLGHVQYVGLYLLMMVVAATVHVHFVATPAIGASAAIYGVIGLFVVFFPRNDISCLWFCFYRLNEHFGTFEVSSIWIILYWVVAEIVMAALELAGNVGTAAHLAGFATGLTIGLILVLTGVLRSQRWEQNLIEVFQGRP